MTNEQRKAPALDPELVQHLRSAALGVILFTSPHMTETNTTEFEFYIMMEHSLTKQKHRVEFRVTRL